MHNQVQRVLSMILERFRTGDLPQALAYAMYPRTDVPSANWSFLNKLTIHLAGTTDARGIRQWNRVGRFIKKDSKAVYILVPRIVKQRDPTRPLQERVILAGFLAKPVFRVEDTDGEPLEYQQESPLPNLSLLDKAREWGITISTGNLLFGAYGAFSSRSKTILLATPEESVFFHELSHASYERIIEPLRPGQQWDQEIIAELSAQALCHLVGKTPGSNLGNSYAYIESYAKAAGMTPMAACLRVLDSVERVLAAILDKDELAEAI
jgi:hypothetical protein